MSEADACAFCGPTRYLPYVRERVYFGHNCYMVCCPTCQTTGPAAATSSEAVIKWNNRKNKEAEGE